MRKREKLYKVLAEDGSACHGGTGKWHLPRRFLGGLVRLKGRWMPKIKGRLLPCVSGYHLCREEDILSWLGEAIFEAEYRGERQDQTNKVVVRKARLVRRCEAWDARAARHFACDCAERVLPVFEEAFPDNKRPRRAIEVARAYADGYATKEELETARSSAWVTGDRITMSGGRHAKIAAWAAAGAANTHVKDLRRAATHAREASEHPSWVEREWQVERLLEYVNGNVPDMRKPSSARGRE
jgi:hypothetical protein